MSARKLAQAVGGLQDDADTLSSQKAPIANPTFTGLVTAPDILAGSNSDTSPTLRVNGAAGSLRSLVIQTAGLARWLIKGSSSAETGGNAGTNFGIERYDDSGVIIDVPFSITRSTGQVTLTASPIIPTPPADDNTTKAATTAFVQTEIASLEPSIGAGTTAQYWRGDKSWRDFATDVRASVLTGLSTSTNAVITSSDTVLSALGKIQKQISDWATAAIFTATVKMRRSNSGWNTSGFGDSGNNGTLFIEDATNNAKKLAMGYDPVNDCSVMQSVHAGSATKDLAINPSGGNIPLGGRSVSASSVFGVPYIPVISGAPSGTPNAISGQVPLVYDTTNNKLWVYNGAWKGVVLS